MIDPSRRDLRRRPFTVANARQVGLRWVDLQTRSWTRMSHGQYAWVGLPNSAKLRLQAVADRMPHGYAFSGLTAGWLLGLDVAWSEPVEVTIDREVPVRARAGIRLRRAALLESEVVVKDGFRLTSAMRTVCDLGSRRDRVESVVALDMALREELVTLRQLEAHVDDNPGAKGIRRLRRAVAVADAGSESPMESRLRMLLINARLPHPSVQTSLHDASGGFIGRVDLYYADRRLVIEYDGDNHRDRLIPDLRRQNALLNAGYHLLRFTVADLREPGSVVAQVRRARATLPQCFDSPDEAA